jgi:hypothetical protein
MKKKFFLRLICAIAAFVAVLWLAGFWYRYVTPVTVRNGTSETVRHVKIELEGKILDFGTLEPAGDGKIYGIPGTGETIGISMEIKGRTVRRYLDYMGGFEGRHWVVIIHSADDVSVIMLTDSILK